MMMLLLLLMHTSRKTQTALLEQTDGRSVSSEDNRNASNFTSGKVATAEQPAIVSLLYASDF